jgi:hypothetical protein
MLLLAFCAAILSSLTIYPAEHGRYFSSALDGLALSLGTTGASVSAALRRRRGRPRKFAGPSRAVTLTLPDTVIEVLRRIDHDLSRAVVGLTRRRGAANGRPPAELAVFGRRAVITVQPTPALAQRTGVDLVPLPDGRALVALGEAQTAAELELLLNDAIEDPKLPDEDRRVFESVGTILRDARRATNVALHRRSIIVLESPAASRPLKPSRKATR